jgi:hypothetical protein
MFLFGSEDGEFDGTSSNPFPNEPSSGSENLPFHHTGNDDARSVNSDDSGSEVGGVHRNARTSAEPNPNPNPNTRNATPATGTNKRGVRAPTNVPRKSEKPSTDIDISHYPEIDGFKYQLKNSSGDKEFKIIAIREDTIEALRRGIKISNAEPKNFIQDKDLIDSFNYIIKSHHEVIDKNSFKTFLEKELEQTNNPFREIATSYEFKKTFEKRMDNSNSISSNVEQVLEEAAKEIGMVLKCVPTSMEDLIKIGGEINDDVKKWLENLRRIGASESEALGSTVYIAGVLLPTTAVAGVECVGILICLAGAAAPLIIGIAALGLAASQFAEYIEEQTERTSKTDVGAGQVAEASDHLKPALVELSHSKSITDGLAGASVSVEAPQSAGGVSRPPAVTLTPGDGGRVF